MSEKVKLRMSPTTTSYHDDKEYDFEFEMPGVKKGAVKVTTTATSICVTGTKEDIEYSSCFSLTHQINSAKVKAKFADGLLTVVLPFKEPIKTTEVKVE